MGKYLFLSIMCLCCTFVSAQTLTKDAFNNFARYTQKSDLSSLEKARKNIDDLYKTAKDSGNYRINLIRSLVYSSLAFTDSARKYKYVKDPIDEAQYSLSKLINPKLNYTHQPEIKFIKKQLTKAWITKAGQSIKAYNYKEAYSAYLWIDSLSEKTPSTIHNLAFLSEKLGYPDKATSYYNWLLQNKSYSKPDYYLALSNLYEQNRNTAKAITVIGEGRQRFPDNKHLLFKQINIFAENGEYTSVINLVEEALKIDPYNLNLIYLAGFAFEVNDKIEKAEEFYKTLISLESNNYEGNYALGLLYLNLYLKEKQNIDLLSKAKKYLILAGEIDPNSINVLKSLIILHTTTNNKLELNRVNSKLNQIILN